MSGAQGMHLPQEPCHPAQFYGDIAAVGRGEYTGQVYCPLKTATIAAMKCGEYQERDGCGAGCPNAASREEIAALEEERRIAPEAPDKGNPLRHANIYHRRGNANNPTTHDYGMCVACKREPAAYKQSRECTNCYRARKYKGQTRSFCGVCGRRVRTPGATICRPCNGKIQARGHWMGKKEGKR